MLYVYIYIYIYISKIPWPCHPFENLIRLNVGQNGVLFAVATDMKDFKGAKGLAQWAERSARRTADLHTKILDVGGLYSSRILICKGQSSHVHGEFPGKCSSRSLSRDTRSR